LKTIAFDEGMAWLSANALTGKTIHFLLSDLQIKQTYLMAGVTLPTGTLTVQSTKGFSDSGTIIVAGQSVAYTGRTATTFTGCTSGTGVVAVNAQITQAGGLTASSLLANVGEITGWTGTTLYARKTEVAPAIESGSVGFAVKTWTTVEAVDGPTDVRTVVAATTSDNSGKALCAWHVDNDDGEPNDMSLANATLEFTPTLSFYNVGGAS
jgi:hypothetical protein